MRDPLVLPLAAFCAGVVLAKWAGFNPAEALRTAGAFGALALLAGMAGKRWLTGLCLLLGLAGAGAARWALQQQRPLPAAPPLGVHALEGCAVTAAVVRNGRERFELGLASGARIRLNMPARRDSGDWVRAGDRISATVRVTEPASYRNPGAFDYAAWLRRRGIHASGSIRRADDVRIVRADCPPTWGSRIQNLRAAGLRRIDAIYDGNVYAQGMMRGLLLGDASGIRDAWVEGFRRTGTFHALVISGGHVTFLAGLFLLWTRWIHFGRTFALVSAAALAWLYALVAGAEPPAIRAAAGFSLFVAAKLIYRPTRILNLTAGIALIFLAVDPGQLFEASFQLSFLAVAAIGAFAQPCDAATTSIWRAAARQPRGVWQTVPDNPRVAALRVELHLFAETLRAWTRLPMGWCWHATRAAVYAAALVFATALVSGVIQVALALPMMTYFHRLSLSGVSANVFAVPLVTLAIPAGFIALFTSSGWVAGAALWFLEAGRAVVDWHARWEPEWRIPDPPAALAVAFCGLLAALAVLIRRRSRWAALAGASVLAVLALMVVGPERRQTAAGRFELTAIDVGQGDSFFLAFPDGSTALIDTGGLPSFGGRASEFDIGEEVVSPYLWWRGVRRLDLLLLTHFHADHAGGAAAVIRNFRPRRLWIPEFEAPASAAPLMREALRAGARIERIGPGEVTSFGGLRWNVIAPFERPLNTVEEQNQSLVFRLTHGERSFLMTGDAEAVTQARLIEAGLLKRADVLKVPHHGSRRSTLPEMLDTVRPAFAIIPAGRGNRFGHPHREVVEALSARGAAVLRTDTSGLVTILSDGRRLEVRRWSQRAWMEEVWNPFD
jgi:competence protein ComEC